MLPRWRLHQRKSSAPALALVGWLEGETDMLYYKRFPKKLPKNPKLRQRRIERETAEINLLLNYLQQLIAELDAENKSVL